jgi:ABC-2 type transport system ATP-binding protein
MAEQHAIAVEGVSKRFGGQRALDGVSFEQRAGTVLGLLGPNGAGKTTAVRVLATLLRPDGGQARVSGLDVVTQAAAVRRLIGLSGQYAAVDQYLTGRENLQMIGRMYGLSRHAAARRAEEMLERFGLTAAAGRPARTYSGGTRRRLDVAASLVGEPAVLFLDEPTTGLDPYSRNEVWAMIGELVADGTTVVLTTQYLEEADRLASRVAVVDVGRVIANDTPAALKARLGSTVIELGFADAAAGERAQRLLTGSPGAPELDGTTVRLSSHDGAHLLVDALRTLDGEGLVPSTLNVREPSLDDVFLALTGHHAEASA